MKNIQITKQNSKIEHIYNTIRKRPVVSLCAGAVLVLASAYSCCVSVPETTFYASDLNWHKDISSACHMEKGHSCAKEFEITKKSTKLEISVVAVTWKNDYTSNMKVSLWKNGLSGELIMEDNFSNQTMKDQAVYKLTLTGKEISEGRYVILFTTDEAEKKIGLGIEQNQLGSQYIRDGKIIQDSDLKISITQ